MRISTKTLFILSVGLMMTVSGCSTTQPTHQPKRKMPVNLLSDCQEQAKAPDGKLKTVLRTSIERSEQYEECKNRHKALSDWVRNEANHAKDER